MVIMLSNNTFFKPTPLYKEFMILDLIKHNKDITQREVGESIGVAVSMVNNYLDDYELKGFIKRKHYSAKTVEYFVTKKGTERMKLLNIWYLISSQKVYQSAKDNIVVFLKEFIDKGFRNILLYGAGEVAEIILDVIQNDQEIPLIVLAVIDDDTDKVGSNLVAPQIIAKDSIIDYEHDGILISSYTHHKMIKKKLVDIDYPKDKILQFFE